jgi:hypothetical protein
VQRHISHRGSIRVLSHCLPHCDYLVTKNRARSARMAWISRFLPGGVIDSLDDARTRNLELMAPHRRAHIHDPLYQYEAVGSESDDTLFPNSESRSSQER